ncbi:MAG TPA: DUF1592 domain-containing protein [Polyangia bacterium]
MTTRKSPPLPLTKPSVALVGLLATAGLTGCEADRHLIGAGSMSENLSVDGGAGGPAGIGLGGVAPGGSDGGTNNTASNPAPAQTGPRALAIAPREVVRRLGIVLWNQADDPGLIAEADSGRLQNSEDVRALALRMLDDPRARVGVGRFFRAWLQQDALLAKTKDGTLFPEFTPQLKADMARETELFGVHVSLDLNGTVGALYTASFAFPNERLAPIYGLTGITGGEHQKATVPPERAGILTLPGVLAVSSLENRVSPTYRGVFALGRYLCSEVPPPPPSIDMTIQTGAAAAGRTTRDQVTAAVAAQPPCLGCHVLTDPYGFVLDGFDPIGRHRTTENGKALNTTAEIHTMAGTTEIATGARGLAQMLANVSQTGDCFVNQWMRHALQRPNLTGAELSAAGNVGKQANLNGYNIRQIIAGVLQSEPFLAR